jgi:hypothetical protein
MRRRFCDARRAYTCYYRRKKHKQSQDLPLLSEQQPSEDNMSLLAEEQEVNYVDVESENESASSKGKVYNICNKVIQSVFVCSDIACHRSC